jgi:PKD repeat protein
MKNYVFFFLMFFYVALFGQTEISGVINNYTEVIAIDGNCSSQITVDDASLYQVDEKVIIIQMQGAEIDESNTGSFGNVTMMNSAGFYEINEIDSIDGQNVFMKYQLVNAYDIEGKVQMISMPVYNNAEIVSTLTASAWDGNKGGVLALEVEGQLFMNAPIDVSGLGFRGGIAQTASSNNCTWLAQQENYFYEISNWRGAPKGEGIAEIILDKESGRGAQANGGGGANDHNSGGGGGANVTFGGKGGDNEEPSTFGCKGYNPGRGGKGIIDPENRLFLGGGGGAGHENNELGTDGGNGGGIVILITNEFYPQGNSIQAHGITPEDGGGDGAGGGGGGGTILLDVQTIGSMVSLSSKGGNGGLINNNNADRSHGPGGGGSGGRIITNLVAGDPFIVELDGGEAGMSINSACCSDSNNGGQNGEDGELEALGTIVVANEDFLLPLADFTFLANGGLVDFTNLSMNANDYQWDFGDNVIDNTTDPTHSYSQSGTYEIQLIAISPCGSDTITQQITVEVPSAPSAAFSFDDGNACAPWLVNFSNESIGSIDNYLWTFEGGDPATSTDPNPQVLYMTPGIYDVQLEIFGSLGSDMVLIENLIEIVPQAMASFDFNLNGNEATFFNASSNTTEYQWDFGDGSPISTVENPVHEYVLPGAYEVTLVSSSLYCASIVTETIFLDFVNVDDIDKGNILKVFPNPAKDLLMVETNWDGSSQLKVYTLDGKEVTALSSEFSKTIALDIQNLVAGIYVLTVVNGATYSMYRFAKVL